VTSRHDAHERSGGGGGGGGAGAPAAMGAFIDMCSRHCHQEPSIGGVAPLVAFAQWHAGLGSVRSVPRGARAPPPPPPPHQRLWVQSTSVPFSNKAPYCAACCRE